jgi:hypothetical protein
MKHSDKRLLNQCIDLYWEYLSLKEIQSEIAKSGPTQESKMLEFMGDFPQLSNIKPETLGRKADLMKLFEVQKEHEAARDSIERVLRDYPLKAREKLCSSIMIYRRLQKQVNPKTRQLYTHKDCAKGLGLSFDTYILLRDKGQAALLLTYRRKTQDVVVSE